MTKPKVYYHVTCKKTNCKSKGFHYNCDKIEEKLTRVLNELTRYMYDIIKKEIENSNNKKQKIDPNNDFKEYTIELLKKLDWHIENDEVIFKNKLGFTFVFNSLNRKSKKELIKRLVDTIEIKRDKNYNIDITNIKFAEEFISKSSKDYIKYLYETLQNNDIGFIYKEAITKEELEKLQDGNIVDNLKLISNNVVEIC